jgi:hypothetical protein
MPLLIGELPTTSTVPNTSGTLLVDTLVDGLGGEHFRDFESLAEPAFGALVLEDLAAVT